MKLPISIVIRTAADGTSVEGILVRVTIHTRHKNPFHEVHGPSDEDGIVRVSRQALLEDAERTREAFLMDYTHPEADFAGRLSVGVMTGDDVEQARRAYDEWKTAMAFPPDYERKLTDAADRLRVLGDVSIRAEVVDVQGRGSVEVRAEPPRRRTSHLSAVRRGNRAGRR